MSKVIPRSKNPEVLFFITAMAELSARTKHERTLNSMG